MDRQTILRSNSLVLLILAVGGTAYAGFTTKRVHLFESKEVVDTSIVVDQKNVHVAFVVVRGGQRQAVIDGIEQQIKDHVFGMKYSPDGQRLAIVTRQKNTWFVSVDGQKSKAYDSIFPRGEFFSEDSKRWAFAGKNNEKWHVVIDGQTGEWFDEIRGITFSKDGNRLAYFGRRGNGWHAVVDGKISAPLEGVAFGYILFSPDSKRYAYVLTRGTKHFIVVDGNESQPYDGIPRVVFSPASDRLIYVVKRNAQYLAVVDGVEGKPYDHIGQTVFSDDGKHYAHGARVGTKAIMTMDGKPIGSTFSKVGNPIFIDGPNRLAYIAVADGKSFVIESGRVHPTFKQVADLTSSPNGKRLAYLAKDINNQWSYVIDGKRASQFDSLLSKIEFSPDSRHFAYLGKRQERNFLSINGKDSQSLPSLIPGSRPVFSGSNKLHIILRNQDNFVRLEVEIEMK